jgi:CDP-glucose 4,6-dehydratase
VSAFWAGRRVLVTGHTGFKGAWLTLWLHALGAEVTGFSGSPPSSPSLFELARMGELCRDVRGDILDARAVADAARGAEVVFHLAARAIVRAALDDPADTYAVNVVGTARVLEAARDAAIVCVTSDKCYAPGDRPHREGDPLGGRDPYSASKAAQELVAAAHRDAFDVRVATARAGNVIGGGDWGRDRLIPDLVRARQSGAPVVLRHPDAVRPWQHVLCPLAGYLRLAEGLLAGEPVAEAWNFGPDPADERPVRWLVERWPLPVEAVAGTPEPREAPVLRVDSAKARARLSWRPTWDLAAGLAATAAWHAAVAAGEDPRAVTLQQIADFERQRA